MHINTKSVFEWDKKLKKYVEIHNEGYEYNGDVALARREILGWDDFGGGGGFGGGSYSGTGETLLDFDDPPGDGSTDPTGTDPTSGMTCSSSYGPGWTGTYPNCKFTGTIESLGYGGPEGILAGSSWEQDWEQFFDPFNPTMSKMLGKQYQTKLGGLFTQAQSGMTDLMKSWKSGGSVLTGRKTRDVQDIKKATGQDTFALGQALEEGRYGEQQDWLSTQRNTLNMLLGSDIWQTCGGEGDAECPAGTSCRNGQCLPAEEGGSGEEDMGSCSDCTYYKDEYDRTGDTKYISYFTRCQRQNC